MDEDLLTDMFGEGGKEEVKEYYMTCTCSAVRLRYLVTAYTHALHCPLWSGGQVWKGAIK